MCLPNLMEVAIKVIISIKTMAADAKNAMSEPMLAASHESSRGIIADHRICLDSYKWASFLSVINDGSSG
jgi:hypothetical protein